MLVGDFGESVEIGCPFLLLLVFLDRLGTFTLAALDCRLQLGSFEGFGFLFSVIRHLREKVCVTKKFVSQSTPLIKSEALASRFCKTYVQYLFGYDAWPFLHSGSLYISIFRSKRDQLNNGGMALWEA